MPFQRDDPSEPDSLPRAWKAKQRSWVLAGLRQLEAPLAPLLQLPTILKGQLEVFNHAGYSWILTIGYQVLGLRPLLQVFATLVSLLFAVPNLEFEPLDHFESFAGDFEVTKAEWAEPRSGDVA